MVMGRWVVARHVAALFVLSMTTVDADVVPSTMHAMEDEDQDGIMNPKEFTALREKLHHAFDTDASGRIEKDEMRSVLQVDHVSKEFNSMDKNDDSFVSTEELDTQYALLGAEMTVDEVADWVSYSVHLPQYAQVFRDHFVSGYTFPLLMENNGDRLAELGIASSLHRQQLALMMKRKIAQVGKAPAEIKETKCAVVPAKASRPPKIKLQWTPPDQSASSHYQLQVQHHNDWHTLTFGKETSHSHVLTDMDDDLDATSKSYRVTTWNSFGRSKRVEVECTDIGGLSLPTVTYTAAAVVPVVPDGPDDSTSWWVFYATYLFWLDEVLIVTVLFLAPLRAFIYGDANFFLRFVRRLPPNAPTRVEVTLDNVADHAASPTQARLRIKWDRPVDNHVDIVCYCVRWTDEAGSTMFIKLTDRPLPTVCHVTGLKFGQTYKFVVEATNAFGLVSKSAQSTYMATNPVQLPAVAPAAPLIPRDQCYICLDPKETKTGGWNVGLHYCSVCDRQFCNGHKKYTSHNFIMHCPAINGKCVCSRCDPAARLRPRVSRIGSSGSNHG
ncbi:hypothetical protein H310_03036 [Aphanomyces invadans]|uniref:Calmodulin n=1 Tax=Aphanomyces invadans TaxID=157072 RepID=A0A024UKX5_9STRA|nr:hypothetical protein H310_03036 [Aphanomyces invadans]ETW06924.1 hypothetical protein H310_03036 [Aphanomyces invadans]|eukprot:XP_008864999.1 hypothetical protein H310_03036 [Aphanomyces invadans]